jgi:hypothetical protein
MTSAETAISGDTVTPCQKTKLSHNLSGKAVSGKVITSALRDLPTLFYQLNLKTESDHI